MENKQTKELSRLLDLSKNTVFFGGAGVSTESGILDFRSENGLYKAKNKYGYPPEELLSRTTFTKKTELFFRFYKDILVQDAKPNNAHIALAALEKRGKLQAVVTQNIDGLHQQAGSLNVIELHGTSHRHYCTMCSHQYTLAYALNEDNCENMIPKCTSCGGIVRPDIVLYEEGLDEDVVNNALNAISGAELIIIGGTSLAVYPAAGLINSLSGNARKNALGIVVINKGATPADDIARLVIRNSIGDTLKEAELLLGRVQTQNYQEDYHEQTR